MLPIHMQVPGSVHSGDSQSLETYIDQKIYLYEMLLRKFGENPELAERYLSRIDRVIGENIFRGIVISILSHQKISAARAVIFDTQTKNNSHLSDYDAEVERQLIADNRGIMGYDPSPEIIALQEGLRDRLHRDSLARLEARN